MIREYLSKALAEGLTPDEALKGLKARLVRLAPPERYRVWRDPWGRRVVGLLEGDIQDVPEEQLEALGLQGLEDAALEKALNSLPRQARPPLPFYPYGEEATQEILREIGVLMEAEPADLGAHPLEGLAALGWKALQEA